MRLSTRRSAPSRWVLNQWQKPFTLTETKKTFFQSFAQLHSQIRQRTENTCLPKTYSRNRIYYAVDLGETYTLITDELLNESGWELKALAEMATFNVRSLPQPFKEDEVAGNRFYFLSANDGYDASRILDQSLVQRMEQKAVGQLVAQFPIKMRSFLLISKTTLGMMYWVKWLCNSLAVGVFL